VDEGIVALRIMYDYDACMEHSKDCEGSFVYRGRPQKGMCAYYDKLPFGKKDAPQLILCGFCKNDKENGYYENCNYRNQDKECINYKVIFSHYTNLRTLRRLLKGKKLRIIIDDNELVPIVYNFKEFSTTRADYLEYFIEDLIQYPIDEKGLRSFRWRVTSVIFNKITSKSEKPVSDVNLDLPLAELRDLLIIIDAYLAGCSKAEKIRNRTTKKGIEENRVYLYEWQDTSLKDQDIIYQTSTPHEHDIKTLQELSQSLITVVEGNAEHNDNWRIIGINKGLYPLITGTGSPIFQMNWHQMMAVANFIARETDVKTVDFSSNKLYTDVLNSTGDLYPNIRHIDHYGKGIKGTNTISKYIYGIVGGILFIPPHFTDRAPYDQGSILKAPNNEHLNTVQWEHAQSNIIQAAGRLFRNGDEGCRNTRKIVFVMSNIDLHEENGYNKETGARVERVEDLDEQCNLNLQMRSDELKYAIMAYVKRIEGGKLDKISKDISTEIMRAFSHEWVKNVIESSGEYTIETRKQDGKGRPAKYIVINRT